MTGSLVHLPPEKGTQDRDNGGHFHVAKPHHHQDRDGIDGVNRDVVSGEIVDQSDDDLERNDFNEEEKSGLFPQERTDSIHCYSCSRTQRIAKCCSSVALRKFIFSLILAR